MQILRERKPPRAASGKIKITVYADEEQCKKMQRLRDKAREMGLVFNLTKHFNAFLRELNAKMEKELAEKNFDPERHILPGLIEE